MICVKKNLHHIKFIHYKHTKLKKSACVSQEKCKEFVDTIKEKDTRLEYYETKMKNKEDKIKQLQEQLIQLQKNNEMKDQSYFGITDELKEIKQSLYKVHDKIDNKNYTVNIAYNNYINNTLNNIQRDNPFDELCNFAFSNPKKERLDHIPGSKMMEFLNCKSLNQTLGKIVGSIYFDVGAPQNFRWCITDRDSQFGALEYNFESNTVSRKPTNKVISDNVKNVIWQVTDVIEELRTKHTFNQRQMANYNNLFGLAGTELDPSDMKDIKEAAFERRNFPKTLWEFLNVPQEVTEIKTQVHLKKELTQ